MVGAACCGCPPVGGCARMSIILAVRGSAPLMPARRSYACVCPSGWRGGEFSVSPDVNVYGMGKKVPKHGSGINGGHYDGGGVCRAFRVVPL